ncbi:Ppx/GppA phosphatase family-domain-containing protein [Pilaira anomala]|nr:Ppx/GppA phosphatase family-domain-containing protein [Pilaira anomala]
MTTEDLKAPFGVIDMGSNGIRFGIVTALSRHLPVAYEERAPISLLEALDDQYRIPSEVMDQVITSFLRFKALCQDARVEPNNVRVIATEATRIASNSKDFIQRIHDATGWSVTLLSKQEEALISASGIVGSFHEVNGLTMDLGGGSVEISYVMTSNDPLEPHIRVSPNPVSLPYGAAALKKRLAICTSNEEIESLYQEIVSKLTTALELAQLPPSLSTKDGYKVYMSGGGFRCLGYLSMAVKAQDSLAPRKRPNRKQVYPIPIINGYTMTTDELRYLSEFYSRKDPQVLMKKLKVFRISKRRASMIPASCFLMCAILQVFQIRQAYFSEGGVRQGFCYQLLPIKEKRKDPLLEGVKAYTSQSHYALDSLEFDSIFAILANALPEIYLSPTHPLQLHRLLPAAIHLSNLTSHYPKETRAFVSFHMPLASGPLANVPGLTHRERAILSILLTYRQGGSVPDPIFYSVQGLVGRKGISVCKYVGRLMELVFAVSPLQPGIGLIKSGLSFTTIQDDSTLPIEEEEEDSSSNSEDDEDDNEGDNISVKEVEQVDDYPTMQLRITLPQTHSPLIDSPAVMAVIESLDKKVNTKKFDMDEDRRRLNCPNLFSIDIVRK